MGRTMGKLIKYLIYVAILGAAALSIYAYVGPFFGVSFDPQKAEIVLPVTLDAK